MEAIIDGNRLFVKSGITVVSSLAGVGKTTYVLGIREILKKYGYQVTYFDADMSLSKENDAFLMPPTSKEFIDILNEAEEKDVIIIDSLKMMCSAYDKDIMNSEDMMNIMRKFRNITEKTKATIIIVHHSFKEKKLKSPEEHLFGSRAIEEQCDSAFIYRKHGATVVKNRLGLIRGTEETI